MVAMKMESFQTEEIGRNCLIAENTFKIKATANTFNILSSQLYSDKIRAVIRELGTNAYDSHILAGNKDMPFDIHIPTMINPHFAIRDYGVGLSVQDVLTLYSTYFESTKTSSDDYVGSLGLGSKSPFSYTRMFSVTSWFDNTKSIYSAFIAENGCPSIALLHQEPSDEPTGLEIKFAVENKDFQSFSTKAWPVLQYFHPTPRSIGGQMYRSDQTYKMEGTCWKLKETNSWGRYSSVAIQGNIEYPINGGDGLGLDKKYHFMFNLPLELYFEIGDLNFAASRESLHYDTKTISNLNAKFELVYNEIREKITKDFAEKTTLWEAKKLYGEMIHHHQLSIFFRNGLEIEWGPNKEKITAHMFNIYSGAFPHIEFFYNVSEHRLKKLEVDIDNWMSEEDKKTRILRGVLIQIDPTHQNNFFINDINRGFKARIDDYRKNTGCYNIYVLSKKESSSDDDFHRNIREFFKALDYNIFTYVSDLPKRDRVFNKIDGYRLLSYTKHSPKYGYMSQYEPGTINKEDGGVYVPLSYGTALLYNEKEIHNITSHLQFAREMQLITQTQIIYGFTKSKLPSGKNWQNLFEMIRNHVIGSYGNILNDFATISRSGSFERIKPIIKHHRISELSKESVFGQLASYFKNIDQLDSIIKYRDLLINLGFSASDNNSTILNLFNNVIDTYTLFNHIDADYHKDTNLVNDIFEYIIHVDNRLLKMKNNDFQSLQV